MTISLIKQKPKIIKLNKLPTIAKQNSNKLGDSKEALKAKKAEETIMSIQ